jgi:2-polyprenyl-3-methyl-5-hydroxy-6-metoxy-1,4-benzoquinol methylase
VKEYFDPQVKAEFDQYAHEYDALHAKHLGLSGESPQYFAQYKARFLSRAFAPTGDKAILDFGCGIGNLTQELARSFSHVAGYDPSKESASLAKKRVPDADLYEEVDAIPSGRFDAVVIASVLHHVAPAERAELVARLPRLLKPRGWLVVFEHNPFNPLTRKVVRDCEFDANAVLLRPRETKDLLEGIGLSPIKLDYIVFFPRMFSALRVLEPSLAWLPLGAQYVVAGQRSSSSAAKD